MIIKIQNTQLMHTTAQGKECVCCMPGIWNYYVSMQFVLRMVVVVVDWWLDSLAVFLYINIYANESNTLYYFTVFEEPHIGAYCTVHTHHCSIYVCDSAKWPHVIKIKWNAWKWKIAVQLGTSVCVCVANNLAGLYYLHHHQTETSIIITIFDTFSLYFVLDNSNSGNSSSSNNTTTTTIATIIITSITIQCMNLWMRWLHFCPVSHIFS